MDFKNFFRILRPSTISPYAKYISNKPIIDPYDYKNFEKDFSDHIDLVLIKLILNKKLFIKLNE